MSDANSLGGLVRRRRLESGYSLGQLASKVGKTAAEVRSWERDDELPEYGILERLAETLELHLDDIRARLDAAQEAGTTEPETDAAPEPEAAAASSERVSTDPSVPIILPEGSEDESDAVGFAIDDPFTPPVPEDDEPADEPADKIATTGGFASDPDFDLLDAPTEPVPVPIITETAAAARAERAVALLGEPAPLPMVEQAPDSDPGLLRYLEPLRILFDPHNRYLYWIRAGLTIVVMLIFAVVLLDQLGKLLDAVGEVLDSIEPSTNPTDEFDALGIFFA